jgi:hypothetical protein
MPTMQGHLVRVIILVYLGIVAESRSLSSATLLCRSGHVVVAGPTEEVLGPATFDGSGQFSTKWDSSSDEWLGSDVHVKMSYLREDGLSRAGIGRYSPSGDFLGTVSGDSCQPGEPAVITQIEVALKEAVDCRDGQRRLALCPVDRSCGQTGDKPCPRTSATEVCSEGKWKPLSDCP